MSVNLLFARCEFLSDGFEFGDSSACEIRRVCVIQMFFSSSGADQDTIELIRAANLPGAGPCQRPAVVPFYRARSPAPLPPPSLPISRAQPISSQRPTDVGASMEARALLRPPPLAPRRTTPLSPRGPRRAPTAADSSLRADAVYHSQDQPVARDGDDAVDRYRLVP